MNSKNKTGLTNEMKIKIKMYDSEDNFVPQTYENCFKIKINLLIKLREIHINF